VNTDPNLKWCPKPNCGKIIKRGSSNYSKCECGFEMCFKCGAAWHPKTSCDKALDLKYAEWAKGKQLEKCPKCRMVVEKNQGCNHMTCTVC